MHRLSRFLLIPVVLVTVGYSPSQVMAFGCKARRCPPGVSATHDGPPPYWCDPYACLHPWPNDNPLLTGPRNWAWVFPDGGFTAYPGLPGSGTRSNSDYSHINWVVSPQNNAQMVQQKLDALGIPRVPQETMFLGKNPGMVDKAKLPLPKGWQKDAGKEKEKDKDKDADK